MMRDADSHAADDSKKSEEIEARNRLDGLTYQMEKTLNENREKVGEVAGEVETAIASAKTALQDGGLEKLNEAFNQLQAASHKMAESLYQQTSTSEPGGEATGDEQASAAGASSGSAGDDNVIDAEYVDVDEKK